MNVKKIPARVGQAVRYGDRNGSWGVIVELSDWSDWKGRRATVEWSYGKDVKGQQIKSTSRGIPVGELMPISREDLRKYRRHRAWTPEQRAFGDHWNRMHEARYEAGQTRRFA